MTTALATNQLEVFTGALFEPSDVVEVRAVQDTRKTECRWFTASELPRVAASLGHWNRDGYNLYAGINPRKAPGGSHNADVACARSLFVDFDGRPLDEVRRCIDEAALPAPSMIVSTGHGFHLYWLLDEPLDDLGLWTRHQQALIDELGSDRCVKDPSRCMRIPGLLNVKGDPVVCEIVEVDPARAYALGEFPEPVSEPVSPPTSNGSVDHDDRRRAIEYLHDLDRRRADEYHDWLNVGMVLHGIDPGAEMLEEWDSWSQMSDKWVEGKCARKWASFDPSRPSLGRGPVTIAALHNWAIEDRRQLGGTECPARPGLQDIGSNKPPSHDVEAGPKRNPAPKSCPATPIERVLQDKTFPAPVPASELGDGGPVEWEWEGFIAAGCTSLMTGLWKCGKTTLIGHLIRARGTGGNLAGKVTSGKVLVVTEEGSGLWARRRDDLGIGDHASFILRPFVAKPSNIEWRRFVEYLAGLVQSDGYGLVILDTFGAVAPYTNENDAAEMMAALMPLHAITQAGAGLLLIHHPRKGDADEGQASRGSGALPGFVDTIIELRRFDKKDRSDTRRVLTTYSRFDESPPETVIELTDTGYIARGSRKEARTADRAGVLLDILPSVMPGLTVAQVRDAWREEQETDPPSERTLRTDLQAGLPKGRWRRDGSGKSRDPYTYLRLVGGEEDVSS